MYNWECLLQLIFLFFKKEFKKQYFILFRSDMWIEKHIIRPYLAFDSTLSEALQHNLPSLVPPPHHPSTLYPLPTVIFR